MYIHNYYVYTETMYIVLIFLQPRLKCLMQLVDHLSSEGTSFISNIIPEVCQGDECEEGQEGGVGRESGREGG